MTTEREFTELSEFMQYLARERSDNERLPSLVVLSEQLGVGTATLREQLEVARALGLVEVRPKTGIRRRPYQFTPAVLKSLTYATSIDPTFYFEAFSDLRKHLESAYFQQAVALLNGSDRNQLCELVNQAMSKLSGQPIQIPHTEHRELHLQIYRRLNNPFVTGILEAYWSAYEAVGLNMYADISYLKNVWEYHRRMVDAICSEDIPGAYRLMLEHTGLLQQRSRSETRSAVPRLGFE